jgi:hypothetical protein
MMGNEGFASQRLIFAPVGADKGLSVASTDIRPRPARTNRDSEVLSDFFAQVVAPSTTCGNCRRRGTARLRGRTGSCSQFDAKSQKCGVARQVHRMSRHLW